MKQMYSYYQDLSLNLCIKNQIAYLLGKGKHYWFKNVRKASS